MTIRLCTTCGRTFEDDSEMMCPFDGTPLFDMAGSADDDDSPSALDVSPAYEPPASEPQTVAIPEDEMVAAAQQFTPAASASEPLAELSDPFAQDDFDDLPAPTQASPQQMTIEPVGFGDEDDLPSPVATSPAPVAHMVEEDPFAVDAMEPDDAFARPAIDEPLSFNEGMNIDIGQIGESGAASDFDLELPDADDASSLQIAAGIESALDEIDEPPSLSPALTGSLDEPSEPETDLPPISSGGSPAGKSKAPLLLVLVLVLAGAAAVGWYFTMGPGATTPAVEPTPPAKVDTVPTPPVTPPTTPVAPAVVDQGAPAAPAADMGAATPEADQGAPAVAPTPPAQDPPKEVKQDPPKEIKKDPPKEVKKDPPKEVKKDPPKEVKKDPPKEVKKDPPTEPKAEPPKEELNDELKKLMN